MRLTLLHEDLNSAVDQDTLLHGETLLVISTSDSEGISLELGTENLSVDIGAHSSVREVAATSTINHKKVEKHYLLDLIVIDFEDFLLSSSWISDVVL